MKNTQKGNSLLLLLNFRKENVINVSGILPSELTYFEIAGTKFKLRVEFID